MAIEFWGLQSMTDPEYELVGRVEGGEIVEDTGGTLDSALFDMELTDEEALLERITGASLVAARPEDANA